MRMPNPVAHTATMAAAICAPSAASSCNGGRLNSWTTVTVHADVHWIWVGVVGSATVAPERAA